MRIVVVGGTGTIGSAVVGALRDKHDVLAVGHTHGQLQVDIASTTSIRRLFDEAGPFDALVVTAGTAAWKPLAEMTDADFADSIGNKLMGQVNLVREGMGRIADGGSFTLTSGVLSEEPVPGSVVVSLVNAGVNGFVRAAALELPRGVRINVVSPPWIRETLESMGRSDADAIAAEEAARVYAWSVEGDMTGRVLDARATRRYP
jgi:NAD(P)-dependent dehydrogenase (short-subunit alcohol dehydrogenase family)